MIVLCTVLYYLLGVLAPTVAALHRCVRQATVTDEEETVHWIQYFLLLCALHSVVFPIVLKPLSFVMPSWFTAVLQTSVVLILAVPKLGMTAKVHKWCSTHYVEYLAVGASMLQSHVIKPLRTQANAVVDKLHTTEDTATVGKRRADKEL